MPEVSRDQFDELGRRLQEPDGGFSIRLQTGKEPTSGYMVSRHGTEEKHKDATQVTGRDVESYATTHSKELAPTGRHAGGWHNPETGAADLDVSQRYQSHDRARYAMWGQNQDALFDLNRGHSERNFAKLGSAGSEIGKYVDEPPDPDYREIQKGARAKLKGR